MNQVRKRIRLETTEQNTNAFVFLTAAEAAALLRLSPVTLSRWRIEGSGPPYRKFGRRVVYVRTEVVAWADAHRRLSTSEPDAVPARREPAELRRTLQFQIALPSEVRK